MPVMIIATAPLNVFMIKNIQMIYLKKTRIQNKKGLLIAH